jgi:hypothetical protein
MPAPASTLPNRLLQRHFRPKGNSDPVSDRFSLAAATRIPVDWNWPAPSSRNEKLKLKSPEIVPWMYLEEKMELKSPEIVPWMYLEEKLKLKSPEIVPWMYLEEKLKLKSPEIVPCMYL